MQAHKLPVRQTCASDQPLHVQIVVLLVWTGFCSTQALLWWEFGWKVSDVCPVNAAARCACVLQHQLHSSAVKKHPQLLPTRHTLSWQGNLVEVHVWSSAVQVVELPFYGDGVGATAQ